MKSFTLSVTSTTAKKTRRALYLILDEALQTLKHLVESFISKNKSLVGNVPADGRHFSIFRIESDRVICENDPILVDS